MVPAGEIVVEVITSWLPFLEKTTLLLMEEILTIQIPNGVIQNSMNLVLTFQIVELKSAYSNLTSQFKYIF